MNSSRRWTRVAGWLESRFELSRDGGEGNIRSMEGLRGLAVLLVFFVHAPWFIRHWVPPGSLFASVSFVLSRIGQTGVDLFFVLSGYLIYGSLIKHKQSFVRFMVRRCRRLYPAFLAVFAIYMVGAMIGKAGSGIPAGAFSATVYLIENLVFLPGIFPIRPLITVAWSLSYEMFFYIACILILNSTDMQRWSMKSRVIALIATLALGSLLSTLFGGPVRLGMFLFGALLYECAGGRPLKATSPLVALALFAGGLASAMFHLHPQIDAALMLVLGLACFVFVGTILQVPDTWLATSLRWTPIRWLGNMSYSFYLTHSLVLTVFAAVMAKLYPPTSLSLPVLLITVFVTFVACAIGSAVLFLLVERPLSLAVTARAPLQDLKVNPTPVTR
jgi:peptidoglycan/LPS O-acetylase OafA/YrhL